MTYRNNGSYLRFRKAGNLGKQPSRANAMMNWLIQTESSSHHLQDEPAAKQSQNVFASLD